MISNKSNIRRNDKALDSSYKNSFYSVQEAKRENNSYKAVEKRNKIGMLPMKSERGNFSGGNSDGFTHTDVSTPLYKNLKNHRNSQQFSDYGLQKGQMDEELTILRRSIQSKQKFICLE